MTLSPNAQRLLWDRFFPSSFFSTILSNAILQCVISVQLGLLWCVWGSLIKHCGHAVKCSLAGRTRKPSISADWLLCVDTRKTNKTKSRLFLCTKYIFCNVLIHPICFMYICLLVRNNAIRGLKCASKKQTVDTLSLCVDMKRNVKKLKINHSYVSPLLLHSLSEGWGRVAEQTADKTAYSIKKIQIIYFCVFFPHIK